MNNGKITVVISAFPACGKSWLFNHFKGKKILDSDSSKFSWIEDKNGEKTRNPDFPANYIDHIRSNIGSADIILVSSHLEVRQALKNAGISYVTVYPDTAQGTKEEWIGRCFCRGNDISFLEFLKSSWDKFQQNILNEPFGEELYSLGRAEYLADIINRIEDDWLLRIDSDKKSSELAEALRLSEEEISTLVETFKESNPAIVEAYELSMGKNYRGSFTALSANIPLGPVRKFYRQPGCSFIVDDYEAGLMVWEGKHWDEIEAFCRPYRNAFKATLEAIAAKLNIKFSSSDEEIYESVKVKDKMLVVSLAAIKYNEI